MRLSGRCRFSQVCKDRGLLILWRLLKPTSSWETPPRIEFKTGLFSHIVINNTVAADDDILITIIIAAVTVRVSSS